MNETTLTKILNEVQSGASTVAQALEQLRGFPSENLAIACIDHQRRLRTGIPEVIYGAGKSAEQIITIATAMLAHDNPLLITRVDSGKAAQVMKQMPQLLYTEEARMLTANPAPLSPENYLGETLIICAGTSDLPVAEEARLTLTSFGHPVSQFYDAGVAGLHRLLNRQELLQNARVIVVVAGMEGALPSVVAGLVTAPVIAVPTSVGYGASFGGIAALLGMLNSCAPGVAVVNIDNGFGAACMAEAINRIPA